MVDFDDRVVPLMTQEMGRTQWSSALYTDCHISPSVLMGVNKGDQNRAAFAPVLCAVTGCAARKNMDACIYNPSRRQ